MSLSISDVLTMREKLIEKLRGKHVNISLSKSTGKSRVELIKFEIRIPYQFHFTDTGNLTTFSWRTRKGEQEHNYVITLSLNSKKTIINTSSIESRFGKTYLKISFL